MLTSRQPCEQKSRRPARSVALSLDRLRATGGALPTSSPLATNIVYHTVSTPTSAKLPILSPAILPTHYHTCKGISICASCPGSDFNTAQCKPVEQFFVPSASFFDMRLIRVYTIRVHTILGSARSDDGFDKEERHDLSHAVFYHQNSYGLIRPIGGMDCKNAIYTPLQGDSLPDIIYE